MIPFDPCLPYRLRDFHAETQKRGFHVMKTKSADFMHLQIGWK